MMGQDAGRVEYHCPEHGRLWLWPTGKGGHIPASLAFRDDTARTPICRRCNRPAFLRYKYDVVAAHPRRPGRPVGSVNRG